MPREEDEIIRKRQRERSRRLAILLAAFVAMALHVLANKAAEPEGMAPEKRLFAFSILYLFGLFAALVGDRWVIG